MISGNFCFRMQWGLSLNLMSAVLQGENTMGVPPQSEKAVS
jgi:hypothetical protein